MDIGYIYEFVSKLPEEFVCGICQLPMRKPVQTKCGHRFCRECLLEANKRKHIHECPMDRQPLYNRKEEELFEDKAVERSILSLIVKCPNAGCQWQGELRNIEEHKKHCPEFPVECLNQCGQTTARKQIKMPRSEEFWQALSLLITVMELISQWVVKRKESIRLLRESADKLDETKKEVNVAKLVGSSTGIGGGILLGAGVLASIFTMGAAAPFMIGAGIAASAGGGLATVGAEGAMVANSKRHQNKVKKVLKEDKSKQEEVSKVAEKLPVLIRKASQKEKISEEEVLRILLKMSLNNNRSNEYYKIVRRLMTESRNVKEFLTWLWPLVTRPVFTVGTVGGVLVSEAVASGSLLAARNAARGAVAVLTPILVAIDIYQLVTTAKDFDLGSEFGRELREIANKLEEELNDVNMKDVVHIFSQCERTYLNQSNAVKIS